MSQVPPKCTLVHLINRVTLHDGVPIPRLTDKHVYTILMGLLHGKPKRINLLYATRFSDGMDWVEFGADGYTLAGLLKGEELVNIFFVLTPKGREYYIPSDGGNPISLLSKEDLVQLTELVVRKKKEKQESYKPKGKKGKSER